MGTSTPTEGIILVESIQSRVPRVRSVGANAMDHAAGTAISMASSTEPNESATEFHAWAR